METIETERKKNKMLKAVIVTLLIAFGVTLYFFYTGKTENTDLTADKAQLELEFKKLSDTLDMRSTEILQITDNNTALDSTVTALEASIAEKKKQIAGLLSKQGMSKAHLAEAKKLIIEYEADIAGLQKQIADLNAQNQLLGQENLKLAQELTSEKIITTQLSEQNKTLSRTVEVGSLLELTQVQVEGVKQKPNGRDRAVRFVKFAESLKISFETGDNRILPAGNLPLYIRIINPKGETISVENQGSGILTLSESNTPLQYSTKADIDWAQASKKVTIYWKQYITTPGTYQAEIYQSGYLIGFGAVTLK